MNPSRDLARYEADYVESDFETVQARMRKRQVMELLHRWRPRRLLEIGCGTESILKHYRDFDHLVVVEPGTRFASQARDDARGDDRIDIVEADFQSAAGLLRDRSFDCILVSGLLHELADPAEILRAAQGLCTPDTRVHVSVPNARSLHRLLARAMGLIDNLHGLSERQQKLQQSHTFDLNQLRTLCEACGFVEEDSGSYFVKPFSHRQMAQLQRIGFLNERMLDGFFQLETEVPGLGSEIYVNLRAIGMRSAPGALRDD